MATTRLALPTRQWLEIHHLAEPSVEFDRVRLHVGGPVTWYLRLAKKSAITFGHHVWFRDEQRRNRPALVAHELVHVAQYRELGTVRFLARYLRDIARAGFRYSRQLPLEAPAYARQAEAEKRLGLR